MTHTDLALVIHFHQPVGNLDSVVAAATDRCYRPFMTALAEHPGVTMTLHFSGCLLEWLEANAPDVSEIIVKLVRRGQIELMTGGHYEPILAALPHQDRVGQIRMLTDHLKRKYLADPTGLWLTERVWEQDVVPSLIDANVRYTVVDDTMFHSVGVSDEELVGPFVTEHDARPLMVYAGDRNLRYLIPYKRVQRVMDYLEEGRGRLFVYADDGEKFGEWPDTYERVYDEGWLGDFFAGLQDASDWLRLVKLGDHAADATPSGRVYLPSSSYHEMMTWALPADARLKLGKVRRTLEKEDPEGALPFVRGAPWRSFLAKYPEANDLQKRMVQVSRRLHEVSPPGDALKELYRAQCNCAYWHGAFGGIYIPFMRAALWHHLMRAESLTEASRPGDTVEVADLDADGKEEILVRAPWGAALISPGDGGRLLELDDWKIGANLLAVVARRREAYHIEEENPPEEDTEEGDMQAVQARSDVDRDSLVFDEEGRGALIDVIDGERVEGAYDYEVEAGGLVRLCKSLPGLDIEKTLSADGDELITVLCVRNTGTKRFSGSYATEAFVLPLDLGRESEPEEIQLSDLGWRVTRPEGEVGIEVTASVPGKVQTNPIETAAATLQGLETMHQGTQVSTEWQLDLGPEEYFDVELRWRLLPTERAAIKSDAGVSA